VDQRAACRFVRFREAAEVSCKFAKEREPRVKAYTAIWFLTDGLAQKGRLIIERNVNGDAD